jgi:DNA invertase Pin-like site-specific DNA recombinase
MTNQTMGSVGAGTQKAIPLEVKVKYCLYARKSTESEERQILSIDSQVKEMLQIAEREGLAIVDIRRESHSAKDSGQRPVFAEILKDIRSGRYTGILTWAPDRLSRNAGDLGSLVDLMDQKLLVEIRTFGQRFANNPNEKFLLMILCSQAKLENDNKSVNVKRGLRTRLEMGLWPGHAPTGYLNEKRSDRKCQVLVDPERAPVIKQIFEKFAYEGWSGMKVFHWLKFDLNFRTKNNHHLTLGNVYLIIQNQFYHGILEYPKHSGKFYTGKHEPLITREIFEKANAQLKRREANKEAKEFAFTRLITCGLCGSGVTANERIKEHHNGNIHRYIYYGCTRSRDHKCQAGYIREDELIKQLLVIIDQIDVNELGIKHKFDEEVGRFRKFQRSVLGANPERVETDDVDIKNYVKYLLAEGSITEKRELLACLKSRLVFKDKIVQLASPVNNPAD